MFVGREDGKLLAVRQMIQQVRIALGITPVYNTCILGFLFTIRFSLSLAPLLIVCITAGYPAACADLRAERGPREGAVPRAGV